MMRFWPYIAACVVVASLVGYVASQRAQLVEAQTTIASRNRSIVALEATANLNRLAIRVAAARAEQWMEQAQRYDAAIDALSTGEIPDEILDPRIADIINGRLSVND